MNSGTTRLAVDGPAGPLECAIDLPAAPLRDAPVGTVVICHPHPQGGGTMDNKVVQTLARAYLQAGWRSVRFNYRGVGQSAGTWDEGRGEVDDAAAVVAAQRRAGEPLALAGFSFGAYVAAEVAARLPEDARPVRMVLVGPSTQKQAMQPVAAGTLVIHGEADEVVPLAATLDWARPQNLPVVVFPGVGHFFHGQLGLLKTTVLQELLPRVAL